MAESREVTMKLGAELQPSAWRSMEKIGASAKDAADQEKRYQSQLKDSVASLLSVSTLKDKIAKSSKDIAAGSATEIKAEREYQQLLGNRIKQLEQAARLKKDLAAAGHGEQQPGLMGHMAQAGGVFGLPAGTGMLGMLAALGKLMSQAPGLRLNDYDVGGTGRYSSALYQRGLAERGAGLVGHLPFVGGTLGEAARLHNFNSPLFAGQRRLEEAQRTAERGAQEAALFGQRDLRQNALQAEAAHFLGIGGNRGEREAAAERVRQAREDLEQKQRARIASEKPSMYRTPLGTMRFGLPVNDERADAARKAEKESQERLRQAQAAQRDMANIQGFGMTSVTARIAEAEKGRQQINRFQEEGAGRAGYDRRTALSDVAAAVGSAVAREQQQIEARRQLGILGVERQSAAGRLTTAGQSLESQRRQVEIAKGDVTRGTSEEQAAKRFQLEEKISRLKEAQRVYDDAAARAKQLEVEYGQVLLQQGQQRLNLYQQEQTRLQSIVREEKEREIGRRESFGIMHPARQRTALGIARKLNQGRQLTQKEIEFAGSMPDLFGQRLRNIGMEKTGAGSIYQQVRGLLPELGARQQGAEKALAQVNQQFKVEINLNEQALSEQIQRKIIPAVQQAIEQAKAAFAAENQRFRNQQWLQNRALAQQRGQ